MGGVARAVLQHAGIALVLGCACGGPFSARPDRPAEGDPAAALVLGEDGTLALISEAGGHQPHLEWWPAGSGPDGAARATGVRTNGFWVTRFARIDAGSRIVYRLRSGPHLSRPVEIRAASPGEPFRLALYGNTLERPLVHRRIVSAVAVERPDLVLHTGGLVDGGDEATAWRSFLRIEQPVLASHPLIPVPGPEDRSRPELLRLLRARGCAWTWGRLRIVVVDPARDDCARGALEAARRRGLQRLLVVHEPPFSSGVIGWSSRSGAALAGLARQYQVSLVISGADRHYERSVVDGVTYLVTGAAGSVERPVFARPGSVSLRLEPHYVILDVEPGHIGLRAINLDGVTFDWAVISGPPAGRRAAAEGSLPP